MHKHISIILSLLLLIFTFTTPNAHSQNYSNERLIRLAKKGYLKNIISQVISNYTADQKSDELSDYNKLKLDEFVFQAIKFEDKDSLSTLLKAGANPNAINENQNTPLHYAISLRQKELVALLIRFGADVNAYNGMNQTPLHITAYYDLDEIAGILLNADANANKPNIPQYTLSETELAFTPLWYALSNSSEKVAKLLINKGYDFLGEVKIFNVKTKKRTSNGMEYEIPVSKTQIGKPQNLYLDSLSRAVIKGDANTLKSEISEGADITQMFIGRYYVHYASMFGQRQILDILLQNGENLQLVDVEGKTVLHYANDAEMVRKIIKSIAIPLNAIDKNGQTPLHTATINQRHSTMRALVMMLNDISQKDNEGKSALYYAVNNFDKEAISILLDTNKCKYVSEALLECLSLESDVYEIAKMLIDAGAEMDIEDTSRSTPLHKAIAKGYTDMVKIILEKGISVNRPILNGDSPLHLAVFFENKELVRFFLENGAKVHDRNNYGRTPLHKAALEGASEIANILLEYGADPLAYDNMRKTPIDLAKENNNLHIVQIIRNMAKKKD